MHDQRARLLRGADIVQKELPLVESLSLAGLFACANSSVSTFTATLIATGEDYHGNASETPKLVIRWSSNSP